MARSSGETVNESLLKFMEELAGTVLDVGCGVGAWASRLRDLGARKLLGVEPSVDAIRAAERYDHMYNESVEEIADLPQIDVVIAADVLEHLTDPWSALARLRSVTVAGGALFVSVPNAQWIKGLWTLAAGDFRYEDGGFWDRTHLHWFTLRSLQDALRMTGWEPCSASFVLGHGKARRLSRMTFGAIDQYLGCQLHVKGYAV